MNTLTIPLKDGEYELLVDLAQFLKEDSPEALLRGSVESYLGEQRWKIAAIREATLQYERGESFTEEEANAHMDAVLDELDRRSAPLAAE